MDMSDAATGLELNNGALNIARAIKQTLIHKRG